MAAVALDRHDDGIYSAEDLERSAGVPVLARLQGDTFGRRSRPAADIAAIDDVHGPEADAFRILATKLWQPATGRGARSILVVLSPGGRNARLAPLNLAVTFARQGVEVALAAATPRIAADAVLLGEAASADSVALGPMRSLLDVRAVDRLHLLSLGDEVLLDATLRDPTALGLDDVLAQVDLIILDGVNLGLPSSMLVLCRLADAALVLGEQRTTRHADVQRAVRELAQVGTTVLGAVYVRRRRFRFPAKRGAAQAAVAVDAVVLAVCRPTRRAGEGDSAPARAPRLSPARTKSRSRSLTLFDTTVRAVRSANVMS